MANRRAVGLNFCTLGWLRKFSKSVIQGLKMSTCRVGSQDLPVTSKDPTHPRLEIIVKVTGAVKLLREDEESTVIQIILDLATSEIDS